MSDVAPGGTTVANASTRTDNPPPNDKGLVVRPLFGGPVPVTIDWGTGLLQNGTQTVVGAVAVLVLPANAARKSAAVQNVLPSNGNVRIGAAGVTATTGYQLVPGATMIIEEPFIPLGDVWAISEGAFSTDVLAAEVV